MKNLKTSVIKIAIVAVVLSTTLDSCKKDEVITPNSTTEIKDSVSINTLKEFMSKTGGIPVESIGYNETTEQFTWRGKDQISKTDLVYAYKQSQLK
ncbi:hypothetical protein [Pedobacter rhizosphaerae]|uniref:Uncharacterized protein n=1 Tax=Pedobacter rhizosphaerae TaxID=390241 RepID=A0A1H9QBB1_9SPHI|nr:hypothetical protein [Pedobacter rhizosphaerae]SER57123.1 hypothetical protein SAMN04488023_11191 [Pedobacter rhizosphaerae]